MRALRHGVTIAFLAASCTPFTAAEDPLGDGGGDAGVRVDAGSDASTSAGDSAPPKADDMVVVTTTAGKYAIDAREVTNVAFMKFVDAASSSPPTDLAQCGWKTKWGTTAAACARNPDHPVRCIDWCDAKAYCQFVGKRLCGEIGGGPGDDLEIKNPTKSQWTRACAGTGTNVFVWPYGAASVNGRCNTEESNAGGPVTVGSLAQCVGSAPGLFDLAGNVGEWEDACESTGGSSALCPIRGGSFEHTVSESRCDQALWGAMNTTGFQDVGIRCCKDTL